MLALATIASSPLGFATPMPSRPAVRSVPQMALELPPLPYAYDALEPLIGRKTLEIHHDKHHAKYVDTANGMLTGTELEHADLVTVVKSAAAAKNQPLFNNAGQVFNHNFYWDCMAPNGGGEPRGTLAAEIDKAFGSFAAFKEQFAAAGMGAFGSGWAWLVHDGSKLAITKTIGAGNPLTEGHTPLLTMDVWEHAYYLDYQNLRPAYIEAFLSELVNWDFVAANLEKAMGR